MNNKYRKLSASERLEIIKESRRSIYILAESREEIISYDGKHNKEVK